MNWEERYYGASGVEIGGRGRSREEQKGARKERFSYSVKEIIAILDATCIPAI